MSKWIAALASLVTLMLAGPALASAALPYERLGAFAEQAADAQLSHQRRIAVQQSTGLIFVADTLNDQIDVYSPTGTGADMLTSFGTGDLSDPYGVAIDQSTGAIYVSDAGNNRIVHYTSDGAATPTLTLDTSGFTSPAQGSGAGQIGNFAAALAYDEGAHQLLVADPGNNRIDRLASDGTYQSSFDGSTSPGGAFTGLIDLAIDSTGDIIVVDSTGDIAYGFASSRVERFSSNGTHEASIGSLAAPSTVAVAPQSNNVIVGANQDSYYSNHQLTVHVFGPDNAPLEDFELPPATVYSLITGLAVDDGPGERLHVATDNDSLGGSFGRTSVQVYERPVPAAPDAITGNPSGVTDTAAVIAGLINPHHSPTTYHVEYGPTTSYGSSAPAGPGASAGDGGTTRDVQVRLTGLTPNTTYHYRVVATNGLGVVEGSDRTLVTFHAADGPGTGPGPDRAYEMVTPVDKRGLAIPTDVDAQSSPSGESIVVTSVGSIAESAASPATLESIAVRGQQNWATQSIDAPIRPSGAPLHYQTVVAVSDDLSRALVATEAKLAPDAVEGKGNLYLRDNETGTFTLIASSDDPRFTNSFTTLNGNLNYEGGTADFSHVMFTSPSALTPDAPGDAVNNLYEWFDGHLRLVSVDPDGSPMHDDAAATLPFEVRREFRTISADGSQIVFALSASGGTSAVYLRRHHTTTVPISVSHRAGDPTDPVQARPEGASADGSIVYFSSNSPLTDDADSSGSLYRYVVRTGALEDVTVAPNPVPGTGFRRVLQVSADGSYVYFMASSALAQGATAGVNELYVWHAGQTRLVAALDSGEFNMPSDGYAVSPNGRYLAIGTYSRLTDYDNTTSPACPFDPSIGRPAGHCVEIYLYDYEDDSLVCASCNPTQEQPTGHALFMHPTTFLGSNFKRVVTDSGRVFFDTPDRLDIDDTNNKRDVYVYQDGAQQLISTGRGSGDSRLLDVSLSGDDAFFATNEQLVGQDVDDLYDVYDARVGGGLKSQEASAALPPCIEDQCQGAPSEVPTVFSPGSASTLESRAPLRPVHRGRASARTARLTVTAITVRMRRTLARTGRLALRVTVSRPGTVRITARAAIGSASRVVARATLRKRSAGSARISIRLSKAARARLRRGGPLQVVLAVSMAGAQSRIATFTLTTKGR